MTEAKSDAAIVLILANHQRLGRVGPCMCGWNSRSHPEHLAEKLREAGFVRDEPNPDQWLTTAGAARLLGVHVGTLYRYVDARQLTRYNPDGQALARAASPMFWRAEVERFASERGTRMRRHDAGRPAHRCGCGLDTRYAAPEAHDPPCRYRSVLALP